MANIVYAAPFAWDEDKGEHIYCTDGLEEWPIIDVWDYPIFTGYWEPTSNFCLYSCCEEFTGTFDDETGFGGGGGCVQPNEPKSVPNDPILSWSGMTACCPPDGCVYAPLTEIKGNYQIYLASSAQDKWIKVGDRININYIGQGYSTTSAYDQAYREFNDRSRLLATYNMSNSSSVWLRDSFMGMHGFCGPHSVFGYEELPGATGYSSKSGFNGFEVPQGVKEDQMERNRDHDLLSIHYGLHFVAVGDITFKYTSKCEHPLGEDSTYISPPIINVGIRERRLAQDRVLICQSAGTAADCNSYEIKWGADLPPPLGASGPSNWTSHTKFRERALFTAALEGCIFISQGVTKTGETHTFYSPWNPDKIIDAAEYEFELLQ